MSLDDRRLEALIRLDEALRAGQLQGRIADGENAAFYGRLQALVKHGLGEIIVGGLHTARLRLYPEEKQQSTQELVLYLWELLNSLDPAPEMPVTEGSVEAVDFVAIRDRIAARLAPVQPL